MEMYSEGGANRTQTVNTQGIEEEGGKKSRTVSRKGNMDCRVQDERSKWSRVMFPVDLLTLRSMCILSYISVFIREIDVEVWGSWSQKNSGI